MVRAKARELPLRLAETRQEFNVTGAFFSGARVRAEDDLHLASLRSLAVTRIRVLVQAHRSYRVAIDDSDVEEVSQYLGTMITTELSDREADSYRGSYASGTTAAYTTELEEIRADALAELRAAQMEQEMPKRDQAAGSVFVFNAPNFGAVAAQIGTVNVGLRSDEFRAILKELLEATKNLDDAAAAEARDLIVGLTNEAEKGSHHSRGMVAHGIERLRTIFSFAADATTVAVNIGVITHLDQLVALFQNLMGS